MSATEDSSRKTRSVIAWQELTAHPWRNGGGITRQILSKRLSETGNWMIAADDWDWRLSIADVDGGGPFSHFPGMTRILTVIEGASISLTVDDTVEELEKHRPFEFDGGAETSAALPHGPIRDLNLIARTDTIVANVSIEKLIADGPRLVLAEQYCVLLDGRAQLALTAANADTHGVSFVELERYDTVVGDAKNEPTVTGDGIIAVISITATAGAPRTLLEPNDTGLR